MKWFIGLLIGIAGSFAGMAFYIAVVGFEQRTSEGMVISSIVGVFVNRLLASLYCTKVKHE